MNSKKSEVTRRQGQRANRIGCEGNHRCCLSLLSICLLVIVYIVCGAIAFFFIENYHHHQQHSHHLQQHQLFHQEEEPVSKPSQEDLDLDSLRNSTVRRLWTLTVELNVFYESNWSQVAELELQKFQDEIMKYIFVSDYFGNHQQRKVGSGILTSGGTISGSIDVCDEETSFTNFPATILYCLTLITTIGYGTVSPKSLPGRMFTVIYACIGIPLTLCYLATVGDFFAKLSRRAYAKIRGHGPSIGVPIPVSLGLLFLYLCGGAWIFWWLEEWEFVDAIFFCFASLATIGFGGMLDPHSNSISLLASSVYILLGMGLISMVFNLVQDEMIRRRSGNPTSLHNYHPPIS